MVGGAAERGASNGAAIQVGIGGEVVIAAPHKALPPGPGGSSQRGQAGGNVSSALVGHIGEVNGADV